MMDDDLYRVARNAAQLHGARSLHVVLLCLTLTALLAGCDAPSSSETAWVEVVPVDGLQEDRPYAVRLTLFRYGPEIGGYAEFFGVDGACNTPREPYFCSDHCVYFGPGAFRDGSFRIQTTAPDGSQFQAQATVNGRRELDLVVTADGDSLGAASMPVRLSFEPDPLGVVSRRCPEPE
jgi:hypothetical protein